MTPGDYVAVYGAVLSTILAIWTIVHAIRQERVRLKVTLQNRALIVPTLGLDLYPPLFIIQLSVINRSVFPIKVQSAGIEFAEKLDAENVAAFNTTFVEFGPAPRLEELGYVLPFTVQPRESGKSAAIIKGIRSHFRVNGEYRIVRGRGFIMLAENTKYYTRWHNFRIDQGEGVSLE